MNRQLTRSHPSAEPAVELVSTGLVPPVPGAGLIARPGLQSLLGAGLVAKLCRLDAPTGSGKTTLLAQWSATAGAGRVAWVSLDEGDNDPTRLWIRALRRTSVDHERAGPRRSAGRPPARPATQGEHISPR